MLVTLTSSCGNTNEKKKKKDKALSRKKRQQEFTDYPMKDK